VRELCAKKEYEKLKPYDELKIAFKRFKNRALEEVDELQY